MIFDLFGFGYPSKDEMFRFFNETNKKSEGGDLNATPNEQDLDGLRKIMCIFLEQPKHYLIDEFTQKRLCLYRDINTSSGCVYYGYVGSRDYGQSFVPHGYGELAFRSAIRGNIFYAGHFHLGIPSGECRFSISGKRGCYGVMRGRLDSRIKGGLELDFYPHET